MNIENTLNKDNISSAVNTAIEPYALKKDDSFTLKFKGELDKLISNFSIDKIMSKDDEINKLFLDLDFGAQYDIKTAKIGQEDAMFFLNMLNQNGLINYQVQNDTVDLTTKNAKSIEVSNVMMDMLKSSYDSKKPIRMDFDNNVTVILKLDDKGKVNAHFIPGDKAVEEYLRNNISYLRQRFDEQNISYSQISYKQQKEQNENPKNKKENKQ